MTTKEVTLKELGDMLSHVVKHMATKDDLSAIREEITDVRTEVADVRAQINSVRTELKADIASLAEQLTGVERELRAIRRDLDELREKVENVIGFRKEIDHTLERIARIEEHLGIDRHIVA